MDPFTNRKVSSDQKKFVENAIILFKILIIDKVEKIKQEYEMGAMTESEYNKNWNCIITWDSLSIWHCPILVINSIKGVNNDA